MVKNLLVNAGDTGFHNVLFKSVTLGTKDLFVGVSQCVFSKVSLSY